MPAITQTAPAVTITTAVTEVTLGASGNTLVWNKGTGQILVLRNPTGGALSPTIIGDAATTWPAPGAGQITTSGGFPVGSIAAGATKMIPLDPIEGYLQGNVTVTTATGIIATLLKAV